MNIFNRSNNKTLRKKLRNNMTTPEVVLWSKLKGCQINNCKFRRQHGIGNYIVDFYCPEKKLVIEIDGDSHYNKKTIIYDKWRDEYINNLGINIIKFTNEDIMNNIEGSLERIVDLTTPNPSLKRRGDNHP